MALLAQPVMLVVKAQDSKARSRYQVDSASTLPRCEAVLRKQLGIAPDALLLKHNRNDGKRSDIVLEELLERTMLAFVDADRAEAFKRRFAGCLSLNPDSGKATLSLVACHAVAPAAAPTWACREAGAAPTPAGTGAVYNRTGDKKGSSLHQVRCLLTCSLRWGVLRGG